MSGPGQREIEAAFVIASPDPARVSAHLRTLRALGPHEVESRPAQRLRDRYFDTPAGDLRRHCLAFREREVDGECLLALKGELGPRERLEIEDNEDEATRKRIEDELWARGVSTSLAALEVIQERNTTRERRALACGGRTIAELALDEDTYRLSGREVRLPEVEVELEDLDADLDPILVELQRAAPELRQWPHNKLVTGAAIAAALEHDELSLDPTGTLLPDGLDQLARRLASGGG